MTDTLTLGQKQRLFTKHVALLILKAYELGYEMSLAWAYDPPDSGSGRSPRSLHRSRLAIDLNLFKDGEYLTSTEDHRELGEWWEHQHELACWGGRFNDGNHYSFTHDGRK